MLLVRSLIFNVLFYTLMAAMMIAGLPLLFRGRRGVFFLARIWTRASLWLLERICGLRTEFRGLDRLPEGAVIVASKHQSFLETFALALCLRDFSFILKRELTWIPGFGWYLRFAEMIAIDRSSGRNALTQVLERSKQLVAQNRQVVIFPEGTRRPVGAPPAYKHGVAHLYAATGVTCVPVALNTGLFWPRRQFLRKPGVAIIEFLEPIPPGLEKDAFFATLQERVETATARLVAEALDRDPALVRATQPETPAP